MIVPIFSEELFSAAMMFKISTMINLGSIIGHVKYGYDHYYHGLDAVPDKPENRLVKYGSSGVWNYANCTFFIAAALNWQWSSTNGPATWTEELIFWSLMFMNAIGGFKYFMIGFYQPMIPLWYASFFSAVGYLMAVKGRNGVAAHVGMS